MKAVGNVISISKDFLQNKYNILLSVTNVTAEELTELKNDIEYLVEIKKYHKKRSLDANAYMWMLVTKIAEVIKSSKDEVYEEMLQKYGYCYQDDNGYITVTVKSCVDMTKVSGHWKLYRDSSDGKFKSYMMIKGTSEYDSKEMAHFLDMVVQDAKELGIETEPQNELNRMLDEWGKEYAKRCSR